MNPTTGNWTYNPDFAEVQVEAGTRAIATLSTGVPPYDAEIHANGYLMAASCELRDELMNLSRAVRAFLDAGPNYDGMPYSDVVLLEQNRSDVEVMIERAERALRHSFPPEEHSDA